MPAMAKLEAPTDPTVAYLHAHGIRVAPGELEEMVREAVERLHRTLYRPDPRPDLTAAEAAVLLRGGFVLEPADLGTEDPLVQTAAELAALLQESLPTAEAAARLGVDPSRIRQRLTSEPPSLYGIRLASGWVVPVFQLEGDKVLPGIAEVVARLDAELHPVAVFRWFHLPNADLALERDGDEPRLLSPRDWLRLGLPAAVVAELAAQL
ncbi:MAG TPA: hypothetical protein DD490_18340 [Acidobacteria bacterium]|nr:hypothetical protein [Acidobacteriota bacterium]